VGKVVHQRWIFAILVTQVNLLHITKLMQVRDTVVEELSASDKTKGKMKRQGSRPLSKGKYSRLEADISSMQRDSATYCDEPADTADYQAWRSKFNLASYKPAVDDLIADNAFMAELQARIVPVIVEYEAFWTRYFYRLHLLEVDVLQLQAALLQCIVIYTLAVCAVKCVPVPAYKKQACQLLYCTHIQDVELFLL